MLNRWARAPPWSVKVAGSWSHSAAYACAYSVAGNIRVDELTARQCEVRERHGFEAEVGDCVVAVKGHRKPYLSVDSG